MTISFGNTTDGVFRRRRGGELSALGLLTIGVTACFALPPSAAAASREESVALAAALVAYDKICAAPGQPIKRDALVAALAKLADQGVDITRAQDRADVLAAVEGIVRILQPGLDKARWCAAILKRAQ
ncbi:hypothetical protein ABEG18_05340 [Alsobacter sp. KACC 23698]|uniref:Uncharacterized protein n=1 Tax=Alsobacter sp. KACC 23698 TaxID=3149229 RepID=A0AAU7JJ46_9HYPH